MDRPAFSAWPFLARARGTRRGARVLLALLLAAGASAPAWAAPPRAASAPEAAAAAAPAQRLEQIELTLRGRPVDALAALAPLLPRLGPREQTLALLLRGQMHVRLGLAPALDNDIAELEALAAGTGLPGAAAAARLLRADWLRQHGSLSRADKLLAEVATYLPSGTSPRLNLAYLEVAAAVKEATGTLDEALRLGQEAVRLAEAQGAKGNPWRLAERRSALAYTLLLARQTEAAFRESEAAVRLARGSGDPLATGNALNVHAMVLGAMGRKAEELAAMKEVVEQAARAGALRSQVLALANLADYYLYQGDASRALGLAQQALPLARKSRDRAAESVALTNAGLAMIHLGQREQGVAMVEQSLALERRAGATTQVATILGELGQALERSGHLGQAYAALSEHRRLSDEVFRQRQQDAMLELQEGFDAERRQRETALLQTANSLQEAQLLGHDLQQRLWAVGLAVGMLLLATVGLLLSRMRRSNAELSSTNAQLQVASERDPLTGLANRRHVHAVMRREHGEAFAGSLLLMDIDHFKRINDRHGHAAGDAVLVEIAQRVRSTVRDVDLVARWGGEEFLLLLPGLDADGAEALAQRLLQAVAGAPVAHAARRIAVSASIGFASYPLAGDGAHTDRWAAAVDLVDAAMYLAKSQGRNRACGVRALPGGPLDGPLEAAWRAGRVDLVRCEGPAVAAAAAEVPA